MKRDRTNTLAYETVCPVCYLRYGSWEVFAEMPTCADCSGEAMTVGVERLDEFISGLTLEDLDRILADWDAADGFKPEYKAEKRARIVHLRGIKAQQY